MLFILGGTMLVGIAVMTLVLRAAVQYGGKVVGHSVFRRHRDAEYILKTGRIPPAWQKEEALDGTDIQQTQAVRQLDQLVRYFQTSPCVADEDTRQILIERLDTVRRSWMTGGSR